MRIAYVTQWFEPEPNIIKGVAFVRALEAAGHEVTIITGLPNYPTGEIYPGYRFRLVQHERLRGVRVVRLPLYPSHNRSTLHRSLNYLSFFASALIYLLVRRSRFDMAYVYHPPITVGVAAALSRIPFVLDVQDLWPDMIAAAEMKGASRLVGCVGACCRFVYARALSIVVQSEGMRQALVARGVAEHKLSVIRNWATAEPAHAPTASAEPFTLVYGGNIGPAQQLGNVIEAAAIVEAERPDIRIAFYGSGLDEAGLRDSAAMLRLSNVRFAGRVSAREISRAFAHADALLLHLGADPLFAITIPSKTQHYLATGRPIVAAVDGDAAELLRASGAAVVVPPANPDALASAIIELAGRPQAERDRMGRAGVRYYRENLSISRGVSRTIALLEGTYQRLVVG